MRAIVFGGAGFLGSHLTDALTDAGYETVIYDRIHSPYARPRQEVIVGDILDRKKVERSVRDCDIVFNFAAIADIEEASENPVEAVQYNILGNTIILDACRKTSVKRFVFASSIYVYSREGSIYRSTKQACEQIIENYNELYGLEYTILRYGSLYGPRSTDKNAIHNFIKQAIVDRTINRHGDGEEIREYIHVLDAARGTVEILDEAYINQHVIITGYQKMRVKDVLIMIREIMEGPIDLKFLPPNESYHYEVTPYNFAPRIGKRLVLKDYLDLGQGILDMIHRLYDDHIKNRAAA